MQPKNPIANSSNSPIGNSFINQSPIGNRGRSENSAIVDRLLEDYKDLIAPAYIKWFAKRFYTLPFDQIHACASEARHDGKDPQRMFSFLIKRKYNQLTVKSRYEALAGR
mgnify:CR=1 FL=1